MENAVPETGRRGATLALPGVTLCAIDCLQPRLALRALGRVLQACAPEHAMLLTDTPDALPTADGVQPVAIPRLSGKHAYSAFVLKELWRHVATPFALLVQWDGWVVAPEAWGAELLAYDYCGAPWWHGDGYNVGNGGFSLRSRRLFEATRDPFVSTELPEDAAIGRVYRRYLERWHGVRFAPEALARRFAYERVAVDEPTFGFHGAFNLWRHLADDELALWLAELHPLSLAAPELRELAAQYVRLGRPDPAARVLRAVVAARPDDADARRELAALEVAHGRG